MGVIDQVVELMRQGKIVKGSIELPDSLVLWDLDYDGICLHFKISGHHDLDDQISLPGMDCEVSPDELERLGL